MTNARDFALWLDDAIYIKDFFQWLCWMVLRKAMLDLAGLTGDELRLCEQALAMRRLLRRYSDVSRALGMTEAALRRLLRRAAFRESAQHFFITGDHAPWCEGLGMDPAAIAEALRRIRAI